MYDLALVANIHLINLYIHYIYSFHWKPKSENIGKRPVK